MSDQETVVRGEVIGQVAKQFGPEMGAYVEQSMMTDPNSPFANMVRDAMRAKDYLDRGDIENAMGIIETYRVIAEQCGLGLMFDAMLESLGIVVPDDAH